MTDGSVVLDLDLRQLSAEGSQRGLGSEVERDTYHFALRPNPSLTIVRFANVMRGAEPGTLALRWENTRALPTVLRAAAQQLVLERTLPGAPFEFVVRDEQTGFVFFGVEGHLFDYEPATRQLRIEGGRLMISRELAQALGRPAEERKQAGTIAIAATMAPLEAGAMSGGNGKPMPWPRAPGAPMAGVPGPDIIVGDIGTIGGLTQYGSSAGQVGLAVGTTSCNNGNQDYNFFQLPNPDHSVVSQNLYRMSGGANNDQRLEQIGQSWVKHTFGANQDDACGFGCTPYPNATKLGVGCSDPYAASQNGAQGNQVGALGSRAWINPFTGIFSTNPRPENHTGHTHTPTSHRLLVNASDLDTRLNSGATYYCEVQYDSPQEYAWCQTHPGECNMYNNASYRRYNVTGTTSFTFAAGGLTQPTVPATGAWTGASSSTIEPAPGVDGRAFVVYKVSGPVNGVWHYEYAVHNQNLDRSIQSFSVPLGCGITLSNLGFHAPPNHPGFPNDNTVGNAGYSNAAWSVNQTAGAVAWNTETFAQNPNANAVRFATMYNFRFDSDRPPQNANATIGFFKTGSPITVAIQAPAPCAPLQAANAVSRKTHGSAGVFDLALPLTGEPAVESRETGGSHLIVITFSNPPVSGTASVTSGVGAVASAPVFAGNTMTLNLSGVADAQKLTLTLRDVTDTFAQVMPETPVSVNFLAGDVNGSKQVNAGDVSLTKRDAGAALDSMNFTADVNASGGINAADISRVKANAGRSVP